LSKTVPCETEYVCKNSSLVRKTVLKSSHKSSANPIVLRPWRTNLGSLRLSALPDMGIRVYLDETSILSLDNQPYWYCGILNFNGANRNFISFDYTFENPLAIDRLKRRFQKICDRAEATGGGLVSVLFHLMENHCQKERVSHGGQPNLKYVHNKNFLETCKWRVMPTLQSSTNSRTN
jgi:hypothetical protein